MPNVQVVHSTTYTYHRPVRPTMHRLMLRPRDSHDLRLNAAKLAVSPPPRQTRWAHDVFGNSVCYLEWGQVETSVLRIVSTLDLDHYPAMPDLTLDPAAEMFPFSYSAQEWPDLARRVEQQHPDADGVVKAWAQSFVNQAGPTSTMELLIAMTKGIKSGFTYVARDERGTNAPATTLRTRSGACRDFALLMMEAVRSLGFAAQFVSGYLYQDQAAERAVIGGGATHAWCAVYLPGAGWVEFDPTNGLVAGRNLIRICTARTPEQAMPLTGGYVGASSDFSYLKVAVDVNVGAPSAVHGSIARSSFGAAA